jgi:hypothetical protein
MPITEKAHKNETIPILPAYSPLWRSLKKGMSIGYLIKNNPSKQKHKE